MDYESWIVFEDNKIGNFENENEFQIFVPVKFKFRAFHKSINHLLYPLSLELFCVYKVEMTVHLDGMASARIADDHHNHATESTHGVSEAHHSNKTGKDTRHRNRVKVKSIKSWEILLRCI